MKKILTALLSLVLLISLCGCKKDPPPAEDVYYTVTFNTAGGSAVESIKVLEGSMISEPVEPVKEGYVFGGWKNGTKNWMFSMDTVKQNITLTATWIDALTVFECETNEDGNTVTITKYKGINRMVTVPTKLAGMTVTAIGGEAFSAVNSEAVGKITLPEEIKIIEANAFNGCNDIDIVIEGKPEYIGEKAFYGCNKLKTIALGEGLEVIPYEAFSGCVSLEKILLPSTLKTIEENAFEYCGALKTVTLHDSIESIGDSAFYECGGLAAIYVYGETEDLSHVNVAKGNDGNIDFLEAKVFYYSETEPEDGGKKQYWHYDTNGNVRVW